MSAPEEAASTDPDAAVDGRAPTLAQICQALRIEPGQTLVVRLDPDRPLSQQQIVEARARAVELIPGVGVVFVQADEIAVADAPQGAAGTSGAE